MNIIVVGAGLIGTSIALAAKQRGDAVMLEDTNSEHLRVARDLLGIDSEASHPEKFDLVIVATPSQYVFRELENRFNDNPQATFIDVSGLKSELIVNVEKFPALAKRFCATHPMAGRELSGPTSARADLFQGATWILTPTSKTDDDVIETVKVLATDLGAKVQTVPALTHDKAISAVSHLPQLVSTILARTLKDVNDEELGLAGQGLRDLTRLADSSATLWAELLLQNKENVVGDLRKVQAEILEILSRLESGDRSEIEKFIDGGKKEKARIPGKHGGKTRDYVYLPIVIEDKAGQLAAIFDECATVRVNVEDLFIEHSPGQETGLITLALSEADANILLPHLVKQNWRVHGIRASR